MASLHADKGWLFVAFSLPLVHKRSQVRLYPGIRDTREGRRAPIIKQIRELIELRRWDELALKFPACKQLQPFAPKQLKPDTTTFHEASERFLAHQANINVPATVEFYRRVLRRHIWPQTAFAEKPLRMVGPSDIAAVWAGERQHGHFTQAMNIRRTIAAVCNWARTEPSTDGDYLLRDNPVTRTRQINIEKAEDDIDPFTPDEARRIFEASPIGWQRRLVVIAICAGLRPNENFGLMRKNINLTKRQIEIRQTWSRFGRGAVKTRGARREVDMSEPVYEAAKAQLAEVQLRSPWLWPAKTGEPANPNRFSGRNWPAILRRAGVKRRRFYQCRHTFATLMLTQGADWRYIADQMGHVDLRTLQTTYWRWRKGTIAKPDADLIVKALNI